MSKMHNIPASFGYAWDGLRQVIKTEPNFRVHVSITITVLLSAVVFGFNRYEWIVLAFAITFVLILELVNTSIEKIVDMTHPYQSPEAKFIKDVSAAAVLISAIMAAFVGLVLFLPKIASLV